MFKLAIAGLFFFFVYAYFSASCCGWLDGSYGSALGYGSALLGWIIGFVFLIQFLLRQISDSVLDARFKEQQSKKFKNWPILKYSRLILRIIISLASIFIALIFLIDTLAHGQFFIHPTLNLIIPGWWENNFWTCQGDWISFEEGSGCDANYDGVID